MYELLKGEADYHTLRRPANIEYHCAFDTVRETGEPHFLHGVAVEGWRGRLAVCFAYNDKAENSITEQLLVRWSDDDGKSWSKAERIAPLSSQANSHSVFLSTEDELWCFGPRFKGLGEPPLTSKGYRMIHFVDLQMEAWRFDGATWQTMGVVADDFWPLSAPVRMADGNWLLAGCDTRWYAAVAISHGNDLLHWDVVKPDTDGECFTEAGAWTWGREVLMVMRNQSLQTNGKYHATVALSRDYGRHFEPCEVSNLPMATTKPFCGRLNDGRPFMVFNASLDGKPNDRGLMLLGVGDETGSFSLDRLFLLDEGAVTPEERRLRLSYPYARQLGDRLYICYSYESAPGTGGNHNDAMLTVVNLCDL